VGISRLVRPFSQKNARNAAHVRSVSVAQKTAGYVNGSLDFTPDLFRATDFVDDSLKKVVDKLIQKKIYDDTLILICSKHGQAPINPNLYGKIDPALVQNATGVDVLWVTVSNIYFVAS
jgi:predicted AlkP superfamily pyrophosphatase or phosphodiesterase